MPQGMPTKANLTVPTAPHREPPSSGHAGFARVAHVAALAKGWLKVQAQIPFTAADLVTLTKMALEAQRDIDDEAKKPKQTPAAPVVGAQKRIEPKPAKKEPNP